MGTNVLEKTAASIFKANSDLPRESLYRYKAGRIKMNIDLLLVLAPVLSCTITNFIHFVHASTLKMVSIYQTTQNHIPDYIKLNTHYCENLKTHLYSIACKL
jgi:hypothetical protein